MLYLNSTATGHSSLYAPVSEDPQLCFTFGSNFSIKDQSIHVHG